MASAPQSGPSPAVGRLAAEFVLDFLRSAARVSEHDFIDGVIRTAILNANVRHIAAEPETSFAYAGFNTPLPDGMRRPASINAIAGSLDLPFETVRRRIHALAERDMVLETREGVILAQRQLVTPQMQVFAQSNYDALLKLYRDLTRLAPEFSPLADAVAGETQPEAPVDEPVRLAMRFTSGFVLRYLEVSRPIAGELFNAILFLAVAVLNVEHITHSQEASARYAAPGAAVPDEARRRVSVRRLAGELGLSFETVRRRTAVLVERGACVRDAEGLYVTQRILLDDLLVAHRRDAAASLQRLFTALWRLGVVFD